jgi:hypothetical protein
VSGIVTAATREDFRNFGERFAKILDRSWSSTPVLGRAGGIVVEWLRTLYVYLFPVVHAWLAVMIFLTFLLVLGRSMGLLALIIWGKLRTSARSACA